MAIAHMALWPFGPGELKRQRTTQKTKIRLSNMNSTKKTGENCRFLSNNSKTVNNIRNLKWGKNDQHSKVYIPCNFEVNLIAHLGVIVLFSSNFQNFNTFRPLFKKL
jgi:hypothetical protein